MIINRLLSDFVVYSSDPIGIALQKMSTNKSGLVFVVDQTGVIEGVLTDGDFRRWLLANIKFDISSASLLVANKKFISCRDDSHPDEIKKLFSSRILYVPLIDKHSRIVAIASNEQIGFKIGNFEVSESKPALLIAEIGNNHQGNLNLAKKLIDQAVSSGANCAKFQMRYMKSLYGNNSKGEDLGTEYTLDLLSKFQLTNNELYEVFDYCKQSGILPLCTPWDLDSLSALEKYGMEAYKLASADLTNIDLIYAMCNTGKPIICSTGMSNENEIIDAVRIMQSKGVPFALLHCNSTYPAPLKDVNLAYLSRLKSIGGGCEIGYSGHERGFSVPIAAIAMGARIIEKHFTLDQSWEGNDHKVSLLPNEFSEMARMIRDVELSIGTREVRRISQGEMMNREILSKSLVASTQIEIGRIITTADIETRGPGSGLSPNYRNELIGRVSRRVMEPGDLFFPSDLNETSMEPRRYHFNRPFGIPIRYHDVATLVNKSNFDLLEFHFSYKDLELNPADFLNPDGYDLDFVVHSPELFSGDHLMNLCSEDHFYRTRSCQELKRVIDVTRRLKTYFRKSITPLIIINAGGFTLDAFMDVSERKKKYELIASALNSIDTYGVEIIPQTMPPFPWHFGGQRFHNLFMDPDEIVEYCNNYKSRICLDISHSKLFCNHSKQSFKLFLEKVVPYFAHTHMVDADGIDGEGLQIGNGEIDFVVVADQLNGVSQTSSFIPEIWQGHKNGGEGFWYALDRLESLMANNRLSPK